MRAFPSHVAGGFLGFEPLGGQLGDPPITALASGAVAATPMQWPSGMNGRIHADGVQDRVLELVHLTVAAHQLFSRLERPLLNNLKIGAVEPALTRQQFGWTRSSTSSRRCSASSSAAWAWASRSASLAAASASSSDNHAGIPRAHDAPANQPCTSGLLSGSLTAAARIAAATCP
jgi:hypothetical protein